MPRIGLFQRRVQKAGGVFRVSTTVSGQVQAWSISKQSGRCWAAQNDPDDRAISLPVGRLARDGAEVSGKHPVLPSGSGMTTQKLTFEKQKVRSGLVRDGIVFALVLQIHICK